MSNVSGKYAIVGVAETKVGKRPDASTHSLHLECIKACLDDAGIKAANVDGFLTNQPLNDAHRSYAVRMANMARMHPNYTTDLALGGATPVAMAHHAAMAIEAGLATRWSASTRATRRPRAACRSAPRSATATRTSRSPTACSAPWPTTPSWPAATCTSSALPASSLAPSPWPTRKHACLNANATMRKPITLEDHQNSRWIVEPLRLLDCSLVSDGGGAYIVTSAERARDLKNGPSTSWAWARTTRTAAWPTRRRSRRSAARSRPSAPTRSAGLTPKDMDFAADLRLLHDHHAGHARGLRLLHQGRGRKLGAGRPHRDRRRAAGEHPRRPAQSRPTSRACCTSRRR